MPWGLGNGNRLDSAGRSRRAASRYGSEGRDSDQPGIGAVRNPVGWRPQGRYRDQV